MQIRIVCLAVLVLMLAPLCIGQSGGPDARALAAILAELRGLHEDMRVTQTMEILLAELEMEQGAVIRATDRVDDARTKLLQVQTDLKLAATHLSEIEDHLSAATDPVEQAHLKEEVERSQGIVAAFRAEEQARANALDEAQS